MINPENIQGNCCLLKFQSSLRRVQAIQSPRTLKKVDSPKPQKISLKNYSSLRHIKVSELTRITSEQPESLNRSIIQELTSIEDHKIFQLTSIKQQNPFSSYSIQHHCDYFVNNKSINNKPTTLQKAMSLTKVRFSYQSEQIGEQRDHNLNRQYRLIVTSENKKEEQSALNKQNSEMRSSIKLASKGQQEDEDMRSTMQPTLELPKMPIIKRPKSIISILDEEEMLDVMKQSFILEKHSSSKTILRLI